MFLLKRHGLTGLDIDYVNRLSDAECAWYEKFARNYYDGDGDQSIAHKKEANRRRYRAKKADAMRVADASPVWPEDAKDSLDPEKLYLLREAFKK